MVFYRKYRPQSIRELDSESVRETLEAILSQKSVSHAFLFTGPKGLGKTSAARIVAKVVNCEKRKAQSAKRKISIEPCNKCDQCVSITNGTNLDVLEIDGASNRGIDEIRDLRDKIRLLPLAASKKVYIIDEVHMLTTEAFNALLKTLEEPPIHALFVLCTTEPQKVPATIVSRCLHIIFSTPTIQELVHSFKRVMKGEKLVADDEVLVYIAKLSNNSFRDGAKILEELASFSKTRKVTKKLVEEKYKISSIAYYVLELLEYITQKDTKEALGVVNEIQKQSIDTKFFIEELIRVLHELLLSKIGIKNSESKLANLALTIDQIKNLIELLTKAYGEIKYAVLPQLPLEIAVIEYVQTSAGRLSHVAGDAWQPSIKTSTSTPSLSERGHQDSEKSSKNHASAFSSPASGQAPLLLERLIEKIKPHNHSIAGILRGSKLHSFDGKKAVLHTSYKFHRERLNEHKTRELIQKIISEIVGNQVIVSILQSMTS